MSRKILLTVNSCESRAAIIENDRLVELFYEIPESEKIVGCIYKGRVANIVPGTQSAFVDIGIHKDAYLTLNGVEDDSSDTVPDIFRSPIQNLLKVGQEVVLQILKEPTLTKGPRSTMTISMPGRYLVYMPKVEHIGISRRIQSDKERDRLRSIGKKILPKGAGVVFRTASEGLEENILRSDLELLIKMWQKIEEKLKTAPPKTMLHRDIPLPMKVARDFFTDEVEEFIVDSKEAYNSILDDCEFLTPMQRASLELYQEETPLFEKYNVEKEIERALARKIWLNSGGYIFFDKTEAMHCIDVNSGRFSGGHDLEETVFKLNLEAAKEIARQIRLRNLSGMIIIDFIDMEARSHRAQVLKTFKECFRGDRNKPNVLDFSELGLIQMTRRRTSSSLAEILKETCPFCHGSGRVLSTTTVINRIKIRLENEAKRYQTSSIAITAHERIIEAFQHAKQKDIKELEEKLNTKIILKTAKTSLIDEFLIEPVLGLTKAEAAKNAAEIKQANADKASVGAAGAEQDFGEARHGLGDNGREFGDTKRASGEARREFSDTKQAVGEAGREFGDTKQAVGGIERGFSGAGQADTKANADQKYEGERPEAAELKAASQNADKPKIYAPKKFNHGKNYKYHKKNGDKKRGSTARPHLRHLRESSNN